PANFHKRLIPPESRAPTPRQNVSGDFRLSFPGTHPLTLCFISLACVLGALWSLCHILFVFKRLASRPPDAQLAKFLLQALPVQPDGRPVRETFHRCCANCLVK